MIRIAALLLSLCTTPAFAAIETWPALYDVTGVASDDALNVRAAPNASAPIVGTLAHDATNIEVVDVDENRTWGRVNIGEGSGWVSLAYMDRHPRWFGSYPPITACYGTEPFWGLVHQADKTVLDFFGETIVSTPRAVELSSANSPSRFGLVLDHSSAVILETACNDGMSDRQFGLAIEVLTTVDGKPMQLSGCCTIQP